MHVVHKSRARLVPTALYFGTFFALASKVFFPWKNSVDHPNQLASTSTEILSEIFQHIRVGVNCGNC